jgi:hypothetical protein
MLGCTRNVTSKTRMKTRIMSGFGTLAKIILIFVLLPAGCTASQHAKSTPAKTSPAMLIEGMVQSVSFPGWVFLSEPTMGIEAMNQVSVTILEDL